MIEKVRQMLAKDRRLTLRRVAEELEISKDTAHTIVRDDLGKRISSRFVPQKHLRTSSCFQALRRPSSGVSRIWLWGGARIFLIDLV